MRCASSGDHQGAGAKSARAILSNITGRLGSSKGSVPAVMQYRQTPARARASRSRAGPCRRRGVYSNAAGVPAVRSLPAAGSTPAC